jgi:type I restriction enzyme R subunit
VARLYRAILPDLTASQFAPACVLLAVLAEKIRSLTPPADISAVMEQVEQLLDRSVASEPYVIRERSAAYVTGGAIDLSRIDFDALKKRFEEGRKRTEAEKLRGAVHSMLRQLLRLNRTRLDFLAKFQAMIDAYNAGSLNVEEFFRPLVGFAQRLSQEEKRHLSEQLSEEELALFDLLTRPTIKLSKKDERQVKKVAQELLRTLKAEKLVLDWRKKQQARAAVQVCIRDYLEQLPAAFTAEMRDEKGALAYQHVYDSYFGEGRSICPAA